MTNKKVLKLAVLGAALVCLLVCAAGVLTACDEAKKYHAEFYDDVEEFMNDEFLKENRVGNAYYPNEYYIEGVNKRFIYDETSPRTRTFIVTDEEEFARMFDSFPAEIDFASQMLVVYMFRVINGRPHHMRKLKVEDGKLSIRIKEENCNSDDTTMPGRKCVAIVMDKTEISSAAFVVA